MILSVRPASLGDAEAVATLVGESGYPATREDIAARLSPLLDRDRDLLAVAGRSRGGLPELVDAESRLAIESGTSCGLTGLVFAADSRQAGLGSALVAAAEAWALAHGGVSMRVRSNVVRPEAHAFYAPLGYGLQKTRHCDTRSRRT